MSDLKATIRVMMPGPTLSALSTITGDGKPWVRYVTPFMDDDLNLWIATFAASRKIGQIKANAEVHVTAGCTDMTAPSPYLQIQGRGEVLTDEAAKKTVWSDHLAAIFSGPDDPNLVALKITPYRIELQEPGPVPPRVLEL